MKSRLSDGVFVIPFAFSVYFSPVLSTLASCRGQWRAGPVPVASPVPPAPLFLSRPGAVLARGGSPGPAALAHASRVLRDDSV